MKEKWGEIQPSGTAGARPLVVVLHGFRMSGGKMGGVAEVVREIHPTADFWIPRLPHSFGLSCYGLARTTETLAAMLDDIWHADYCSLLLIGHSTGGPLTRSLYLEGLKRGAAWTDVMRTDEHSRIIMLAGMNNGWRIDHHFSRGKAIFWSALEFGGRVMEAFGKRPTILDLKRSSLYLTKLRFAWSELSAEELPHLTVQLLGTIDDLVGPDDVIDQVTGKTFRYLDVPLSGHVNVLKMQGDDPVSSGRADVMRIALGPETMISMHEVRPWGLDDETIARSEAVEQVIFVIHGIRDQGYWTDKIARHVWKQCSEDLRPNLRRVTSSYGYFGMGPFLFPSVRRKKVEWLVEEVLTARARYPRAKLSYIGHSNGTYLLAKALEIYKDVEQFKFDRVVFAGSVVRSEYKWSDKSVNGVLNLVANRDWVVAFFPQLFELIPIQDLGSAGHNGFTRVEYNRKYADGGHGAGIQNDFWDPIAGYVLNQDQHTGDKTDGGSVDGEKQALVDQGRWGMALRFLGKATPLPVWTFLIVLLAILVPQGILSLWAPVAEWLAGGILSQAPMVIAGLLVVWLTVSSLLKSGVLAGLRSALSSIGVIAVVATVAQLTEFTFPEPQTWGSGLIVAYAVFVVWVLRRV